MTRSAYKLTRIGLEKFLISALLTILGFSLLIYSSLEMTPRSISVSGYTRSDGSYVRGYSRRPSGGAQHDAPFEVMSMFFGALTLFSGFYFGIKVKEYLMFDVESDFRRNFKFSYDYPEMKIYLKDIPNIKIVPKKNWNCNSCNKAILAGTEYFYYNNESQSNHSHICNNCRSNFILHNNNYYKIKKEYDTEYEVIKKKRITEIEDAFQKVFNEKPQRRLE